MRRHACLPNLRSYLQRLQLIPGTDRHDQEEISLSRRPSPSKPVHVSAHFGKWLTIKYISDPFKHEKEIVRPRHQCSRELAYCDHRKDRGAVIGSAIDLLAARASVQGTGLAHRAGAIALMLPASPITLIVQGITEGLVRLAKMDATLGRAATVRQREVSLVTAGNHRLAVAVILFAKFMYENSLQRWWLHRETRIRCRFIPSCTEYAVRAVHKYGFWSGLRLIGDRFRRCNQMYEGDYVDFP